MITKIRAIIIVFTVFSLISSCMKDENTKLNQQMLDKAQQLIKDAGQELDNLEKDYTYDDPGDYSHNDAFNDFSLDIPEHGLSLSQIPDGKYVLTNVTTTFTKSEEKISGGADVKVKVNKIIQEQEVLHIMPNDHSCQKFSSEKSSTSFEGKGFVDWGVLDRKRYDFNPDIDLIVPLTIEVSSGKVSYIDKVNYYSEFETWTNGGQEVEIVIQGKNRGGSDFTRLFDDKYFEKDVYHSEKVKLYKDEILSALIISLGDGTLDLFILVQHEGEERKAKLSYTMQ